VPSVFDEIHKEQKGANQNGGDVFSQIHAETQGAATSDTPKPDQMDTGETFLGEVGKALNPVTMAQGAANAVMHPIDTAKGIVQLSADQLTKAKDAFSKGQMSEAFGHLLGAFPVIGPAAAAAGETMGGTPPQLDKFGNVVESGKAPNVGAGLGKGVAAIAGVLAPGAVKGVKAKLGSEAGANALYKGALKPPPGADLNEVRTAVSTGLENGIPVTEAGAQKLTDLVNDLNTTIRAKIAAKPGSTIDPNAVAVRMTDPRSRFSQQVNPSKDLKAINASEQEFLEQQGARPGQPAIAPQASSILGPNGKPVMTPGSPAVPPTPARPMSGTRAQDLKVGTYQQLRAKYGELSSAQVEAQKALARGLKEELDVAFPEITALNKAESNLLGLQPMIERAVGRAANGEGLTVHGGVMATATSAMKSVFSSPAIKSRLALALYRGSKKGANPLTMPAATARVNLFLKSLDESETDSAEQQRSRTSRME